VSRPSPALVVSVIALVVACTGTATAASVLIKSSKQVAKGSINSSDLANRKGVGLVDLTPSARRALTGQVGATGSLGPVGPTGAKGDTGPAGSVGKPEAFREVGTTGQPAFENGWTNFGGAQYESTGFYKDLLGVVHLKGTIQGGSVATVFTLPAGYRPAKSQFFPVVANNLFGDVLVRGVSEGGEAGRVHFNSGDDSSFVSLNGISFRAAG
jgi:hypothetical protein